MKVLCNNFMNTIVCPSCGKVVEISKALLHEEREKIKKDAEEKAAKIAGKGYRATGIQ